MRCDLAHIFEPVRNSQDYSVNERIRQSLLMARVFNLSRPTCKSMKKVGERSTACRTFWHSRLLSTGILPRFSILEVQLAKQNSQFKTSIPSQTLLGPCVSGNAVSTLRQGGLIILMPCGIRIFGKMRH